jgi:hypothetical protein
VIRFYTYPGYESNGRKRVRLDRERFRVPPPDFEAFLGLGLADKWWVLGKWTSRIESADTKTAKLKVAREWAEEFRKRESDEFPSGAPRVTPERILEFSSTILRLLEQKFNAKPIADEVAKLVNHAASYVVNDEKGGERDRKHLACVESEETFWALEYALLFRELTNGRQRDDWTYAVGFCADDNCGKFFIRRRPDQHFHSDKCRTNQANRAAYGGSKKRRARGGKR